MKKNLRERDIERYLVEKVKDIGGKAYKFSSMNNKAVPDRICFFPKGEMIMVECKAQGKKPTPLQGKVIQSLRQMGHNVLVIDSKDLVNIFIESVKEVLNEK